jgi:hypothetical protein
LGAVGARIYQFQIWKFLLGDSAYLSKRRLFRL